MSTSVIKDIECGHEGRNLHDVPAIWQDDLFDSSELEQGDRGGKSECSILHSLIIRRA